MAPAIALKALTLFSYIFAGAVRIVQTITRRKKTGDDHSWQKPSRGDRASPDARPYPHRTLTKDTARPEPLPDAQRPRMPRLPLPRRQKHLPRPPRVRPARVH